MRYLDDWGWPTPYAYTRWVTRRAESKKRREEIAHNNAAIEAQGYVLAYQTPLTRLRDQAVQA